MRIALLGNHEVSYSSESHHAATLEAMGHDVLRLQEPTAPLDGLTCDLFVWVHTHGREHPGITKCLRSLRRQGIPCITYHLDLFVGLRRWDRYVNHPYMRELDHWFTVDPDMAVWLNLNTETHGHYLPAGVFDQECVMMPVFPNDLHPASNDVVFVGSRRYHPEWPYREKLVDWLTQTYGGRFTHIGGDSRIGTLRGHDLNRVYAESKVVVGDSLCPDFTKEGYWSDRVYETLGRGGFLIHPYVKGMEQTFEGAEHLVFYQYGDFDQLKEHIDFYLDRADDREYIRSSGHQLVKENHTYRQRWETILGTVCR